MNLNDIFEYRDGLLYRKSNGKLAGCKRRDGYRQVSVNGRLYLAHRVIFEMHHGYMPAMIDHIDGDRANNCIENLRECDHSTNLMNSAPRKSVSGAKGVSFNKRISKWYVRIVAKNRTYCGKYHEKIEDAIAEAAEMRNRIHGEFARHA